jgi:hypothetical protein
MAKRSPFTVIEGDMAPTAMTGSRLRSEFASNNKPSGGARPNETFRAGLEYVACDLRELAKIAPPDRAMQVLNLSRLVEAIINR